MIALFIVLFILFFVIIPIVHGLIESLILYLWPKFFVLLGFSILNEKLKFDFNIENPKSDVVVKKKVASYIFDSEKNIYVNPKLFWSGMYNFRTIFSLRMKCKIENNIIYLRFKISAFSVIHSSIFIVGLVAIIIWSLLTNQTIQMILVGFAFLVIFSIWIIQSYFALLENKESMISELKEVITTFNKSNIN